VTRFGISRTHQLSKIFEFMLRRQMLNGYVIRKMAMLSTSLESSNESSPRKGRNNRIQSWPWSEVQENDGVLLTGLANSIDGIEDIQPHHPI
jgi:hypothetical protein